MFVKFIKTIKHKNHILFKGQHQYEAIDGKTISYLDDDDTLVYNEDLKDMILVRQPTSTKNNDEYCCIPKSKEGVLFHIIPEIFPKSGTDGKIFTKDFYITEEEKQTYQKLLRQTCRKIYDKYGLKRDEAFTHTVVFDDDIQMDIQLVICENDKPYVQAVLFDNGCEVACSEVIEEIISEFKLNYNNNTYSANTFVIPD